jgi:hypothetical protein
MTRVAVRCSLSRRTRTVALVTAALALGAGAVAAIAAPAQAATAGPTIRASGSAVTLTRSGDQPAGPVLFQRAAFVRNIAHASAGTVDEATGTVTGPATARSVTVQLTKAGYPGISHSGTASLRVRGHPSSVKGQAHTLGGHE